MTLVAQRRGIGFSGLVNSGPDRLWASAGSPPANDTVYSIDVRAGSVVPTGRTGSFVRTNSLCRGPDGGLLALVDYALLGVDTLTGAGSFQAFIPLEGLRSIAAGILVTGMEDPGNHRTPFTFDLDQNFPNPFNPNTLIRYQLPALSDVRLSVYDMLGREVAVLVEEKQPGGTHEVDFAATGLASGVYFYRLRAGIHVQTRRMIVIR
jgi:hypothetical protein